MVYELDEIKRGLLRGNRARSALSPELPNDATLNVHDLPTEDVRLAAERYLVEAELPCVIIAGSGIRSEIVMNVAAEMGLRAARVEGRPGRVRVER